jgi:hypothetical protein
MTKTLTAHDVIHGISRSVWSPYRYAVVFETKVLGYEADMVVVQRSRVCEEIEVKVTAKDFAADFTRKPEKHAILQNGWPAARSKAAADARRSEFDERYGSRVDMTYLRRHPYAADWTRTIPTPVARFWFAVPEALVPEVEHMVPAYAGLIVARAYRGTFTAYRAKKAPRLPHVRKLTEAELIDLFRTMYFRGWQSFYRGQRTIRRDKAPSRAQLRMEIRTKGGNP